MEAYGDQSDYGQSLSLKQRLSKVMLDVSSNLADSAGGALVQVWMPEHCADGSVVLSAQGLPFSISGVGDLLALYRCVSVRYRFSTDMMKPNLMGAIGRVYSSLEPEMSNDVTQYDKQVYLRVSEAQRCRVHSTLVVPLYSSDMLHKPIAIFELVQSDKDLSFPAVMTHLQRCLKSMKLYTCDFERMASGLSRGPPLPVQGNQQKDRLSLEMEGPGLKVSPSMHKIQAAVMLKQEEHGETSPETSGSYKQQRQASGDSGSDLQSSRQAAGKSAEHSGSSAKEVEAPLVLSSSQPMAAYRLGMPTSQQAHELAAWMAENKFGAEALESIKSILQSSSPTQKALLLQRAGSGTKPTDSPPHHQSNPAEGAFIRHSAPPAAAAAAAANITATQTQQQLQRINSFHSDQRPPRQSAAGAAASLADQMGTATAGAAALPTDADDDISSGGEDEDSDGEQRGDKGCNRVGGGAGKRLRYEDLQAQFGLGLKEAAANMGICATTLKRACRRHGIKRWPRRQIAKLSKALNQMGYQGAPPPQLVQSAVKGQLQKQPVPPVGEAAVVQPGISLLSGDLHQQQLKVAQMQMQAQQMQMQAQQLQQELQMQQHLKQQRDTFQGASASYLANGGQRVQGHGTFSAAMAAANHADYVMRGGIPSTSSIPHYQQHHPNLQSAYSEFTSSGAINVGSIGGTAMPSMAFNSSVEDVPGGRPFSFHEYSSMSAPPLTLPPNSWQAASVPGTFLAANGTQAMLPTEHQPLPQQYPAASAAQSQSFMSLPNSDFLNGCDFLEKIEGGHNVEATSASRLVIEVGMPATNLHQIKDGASLMQHGSGHLFGNVSLDILHEDVNMSS